MKREMEEINAINEAKLESLKQDELPQIKNIEPQEMVFQEKHQDWPYPLQFKLEQRSIQEEQKQ